MGVNSSPRSPSSHIKAEGGQVALPVLIIGAGLTGLTLAQSLKKAGIPFHIYEQNENLEASKNHDGAVTIKSALPAFEKCLPKPLFGRLPSIQIDTRTGYANCNSILADLATGATETKTYDEKRLRVNGKALEELLLQGIQVQYGKKLITFKIPAKELPTIEAEFSDGTKVEGRLLVGADGRNSITRKLLVGEEAASLNNLPIRSVGCTLTVGEENIRPLLDIDPLCFEGVHPSTGVYQWFPVVSTPTTNGSVHSDKPYWKVQIIQSWRRNDLKDDVPAESFKRLEMLKANAKSFFPALRSCIEAIPEDTFCLEVKWSDWEPATWSNHAGKITLAGEAAHSMASFRGEAFNHGTMDAASLSDLIITACRSKHNTSRPEYEDAVTAYETEMRARSKEAISDCRELCLALNSPLMLEKIEEKPEGEPKDRIIPSSSMIANGIKLATHAMLMSLKLCILLAR